MAWRKEEEEVYDGWSTASCFAYSKYSKAAAFWGKTESTQYTDQWADLNTFQPARKKLPEGTKLMPELHLAAEFLSTQNNLILNVVYELTNANMGLPCYNSATIHRWNLFTTRAEKAFIFGQKHLAQSLESQQPLSSLSNYWWTPIPRDIEHTFVVLT